MVYTFRKGMSVLCGHRGTRIMPHDMPFLNIVLASDLFNAFGQALEIVRTIGFAGRLAQAGKIDGKTGKTSLHLLNNAAPQIMIGGYSVDE